MRREETVHHVHSRRETELGDAAQDQRLVGGLLRVLTEHDDPARVERAIHVVMAAMHIQRVLRQRPRADLEHHRRALAGRVVVLLHAVHDALAGRIVDDPLAADRVRDGAALGGMLPFRLDRNRVLAEDIQLAFGKSLLIQFAAFCGRRDGVKDAGVCDARFGVVRNELVPVGSDPDPRVARSQCHGVVLRARPRRGKELGKITRPESSADSSPVIGHFRLFDLSIDHIIDAYPRTANPVWPRRSLWRRREVRLRSIANVRLQHSIDE